MLDKKEKQEFIRDGKSARRKKEFGFLRERVLSGSRSLADFVDFLANFRETFPFKGVSHKKIVALRNKL